MRTRGWRRHMEEIKFKKRIKKLTYQYRWGYGFFDDVNWKKIKKPNWSDFIGNKYYYFLKTSPTRKADTKYKCKYSPNKSNGYYRDKKVRPNTTGNREGDKILFKRMLEREYGIKHYYTKL